MWASNLKLITIFIVAAGLLFKLFSTKSLRHVSVSSPPRRHAIVSALFDDKYAPAVAVLGYSLQRHRTTAQLVLVYLKDRVSLSNQEMLQQHGWTLTPVEHIAAPREGVFSRFVDTFTKLRIWSLTAYDKVFFMDADMLAIGNFDEIFDLPVDFAAAADLFNDHRGYTFEFNSGSMLLRPSISVLEDMLQQMHTLDFTISQSDQGFLNAYYRYTSFRFPIYYNGNIAIKARNASLWNEILPSIKILHYTLRKPLNFARDATNDDIRLFKEEFALWWKYKDEAAQYLENQVGRSM